MLWTKKNTDRTKDYKDKWILANPEQNRLSKKHYRDSNKILLAEKDKIYCQENKEKVSLARKRYAQANIEKIREKNRKCRTNRTHKRKISDAMSCGILRDHLESLFTNGMTWENYGKWHIDHIIPKSFFEFSSPNDVEFKMCWRLDNLQPLWAKDNIIKSNKLSLTG